MITKETQNLFATYLNHFINLEKKIEIFRVELAKNLYFEPYTVFQRLNYIKNQHFGINDLKQFLQSNQFDSSDNNAIQLLKKMDFDKDQYVSFREFCRYILPHKDETLHQIANSRLSYKFEGEKLPFLVEEQLCKVFNEELHLQFEMNQMIQQLKQKQDWDKIFIWDLVNDGSKWNSQIVQVFLKKFEYIQQIDDIDNFIYRNSRELDSRINYSDYLYLIYTLEENNKSYVYNTPIKQKIHLEQDSKKTNTTLLSTNIKSEKISKKKTPSTNYHQQVEFQKSVVVNEFQPDLVDLNILEYILLKQKILKKINNNILNNLFIEIDIKNRNFITLQDLIEYFKNVIGKKLDKKDAINLVKLLDTNRDGVISKQEFIYEIFNQTSIQ